MAERAAEISDSEDSINSTQRANTRIAAREVVRSLARSEKRDSFEKTEVARVRGCGWVNNSS